MEQYVYDPLKKYKRSHVETYFLKASSAFFPLMLLKTRVVTEFLYYIKNKNCLNIKDALQQNTLTPVNILLK